MSVDPDRGLMVVNWLRLPIRITLAEAVAKGFETFDGQRPVSSGQTP